MEHTLARGTTACPATVGRHGVEPRAPQAGMLHTQAGAAWGGAARGPGPRLAPVRFEVHDLVAAGEAAGCVHAHLVHLSPPRPLTAATAGDATKQCMHQYVGSSTLHPVCKRMWRGRRGRC